MRGAAAPHVATLTPALSLDGRGSGRVCYDAVDAAIPDVFDGLPRVPEEPAMPPRHEFAPVLTAPGTYRKTSPEMVVFGRMLEDALPRPESRGA